MSFDIKRFELKQYHIDLLSKSNIKYADHCEWGYLGLDCKRPFGNGDLIGDMAKTIGIQPIETDDETAWPKGTREKLLKIFTKELPTALEIILEAQSFVPGIYEAEEYIGSWRLVSAAREQAANF